ncbi:unnamed protein product [Arctogadus glacialis]
MENNRSHFVSTLFNISVRLRPTAERGSVNIQTTGHHSTVTTDAGSPSYTGNTNLHQDATEHLVTGDPVSCQLSRVAGHLPLCIGLWAGTARGS